MSDNESDTPRRSGKRRGSGSDKSSNRSDSRRSRSRSRNSSRSSSRSSHSSRGRRRRSRSRSSSSDRSRRSSRSRSRSSSRRRSRSRSGSRQGTAPSKGPEKDSLLAAPAAKADASVHLALEGDSDGEQPVNDENKPPSLPKPAEPATKDTKEKKKRELAYYSPNVPPSQRKEPTDPSTKTYGNAGSPPSSARSARSARSTRSTRSAQRGVSPSVRSRSPAAPRSPHLQANTKEAAKIYSTSPTRRGSNVRRAPSDNRLIAKPNDRDEAKKIERLKKTRLELKTQLEKAKAQWEEIQRQGMLQPNRHRGHSPRVDQKTLDAEHDRLRSEYQVLKRDNEHLRKQVDTSNEARFRKQLQQQDELIKKLKEEIKDIHQRQRTQTKALESGDTLPQQLYRLQCECAEELRVQQANLGKALQADEKYQQAIENQKQIFKEVKEKDTFPTYTLQDLKKIAEHRNKVAELEKQIEACRYRIGVLQRQHEQLRRQRGGKASESDDRNWEAAQQLKHDITEAKKEAKNWDDRVTEARSRLAAITTSVAREERERAKENLNLSTRDAWTEEQAVRRSHEDEAIIRRARELLKKKEVQREREREMEAEMAKAAAAEDRTRQEKERQRKELEEKQRQQREREELERRREERDLLQKSAPPPAQPEPAAPAPAPPSMEKSLSTAKSVEQPAWLSEEKKPVEDNKSVQGSPALNRSNLWLDSADSAPVAKPAVLASPPPPPPAPHKETPSWLQESSSPKKEDQTTPSKLAAAAPEIENRPAPALETSHKQEDIPASLNTSIRSEAPVVSAPASVPSAAPVPGPPAPTSQETTEPGAQPSSKAAEGLPSWLSAQAPSPAQPAPQPASDPPKQQPSWLDPTPAVPVNGTAAPAPAPEVKPAAPSWLTDTPAQPAAQPKPSGGSRPWGRSAPWAPKPTATSEQPKAVPAWLQG
eukprot:TRINITY_DN8358_c0_g2_i1.p1 TRINITY_DN8358_c0_g2~~TRINITY_DN8358_c0_g2_i1.p1  ORF type:complete len:936 (+),score=148.46 TRINITY_DN8358_c0_g2_i1:91-2898(+)